MRVILLTSISFGLPCQALRGLVNSDRLDVVAVIHAQDRLSSRGFKPFARKFRKARKIGCLGSINAIRTKRWFYGEPADQIDALCDKFRIPFHRVSPLNSNQTIDLVRYANADLGISAGNTYISERVFTIPRRGIINIHTERLPEYQNGPSVIWPIWNMERMSGLTIHEFSKSIDSGRILHRQEHPIESRPSLKGTVKATIRATLDKVPAAIRHVCENHDELSSDARPQIDGGHYTTPGIKEFLRMIRNNRRMYENVRA